MHDSHVWGIRSNSPSKEERYNRAIARLISYYGRTYNQRVYDKCVKLLSKGW